MDREFAVWLGKLSDHRKRFAESNVKSEILVASVGEVGGLLNRFTANSDHEFWPDDISLADKRVFECGAILGPMQITDVYLLGLAAGNEGRLVTFDRSISTSAVLNADSNNLVVI